MNLLKRLFTKRPLTVQLTTPSEIKVLRSYAADLHTACRMAHLALDSRVNTDAVKDGLKRLLENLERDLKAARGDRE